MKYVKYNEEFRALSVHEAQINKAKKIKTGEIEYLKPSLATFTLLPEGFDFSTQKAFYNVETDSWSVEDLPTFVKPIMPEEPIKGEYTALELLQIERDTSISDAYNTMNESVLNAMYDCFGTTNTASAQATQATIEDMLASPISYVGTLTIKATNSFTKNITLNSEEDVLGYANEFKEIIRTYGIFRTTEIANFQILKQSILDDEKYLDISGIELNSTLQTDIDYLSSITIFNEEMDKYYSDIEQYNKDINNPLNR